MPAVLGRKDSDYTLIEDWARTEDTRAGGDTRRIWIYRRHKIHRRERLTWRRVLVIMKPPLLTPSGRSGALTDAPAKEWLQSRLQQ